MVWRIGSVSSIMTAMPADELPEESPPRWTKATVYDDMWVNPDDDPREGGPTMGDERTTLVEYLRTNRLTLQMKCADLDAEQLARRSVPPSTMSLLGLIRHMAEVERSWFRRVLAAQNAPKLYCTPADRDEDWNGAVADPEVVADAWRNWWDECVFADTFIADAPHLGISGKTGDGSVISLREVLAHMIEEYARHNGHADLLRERIDGRVGQ
jgi:uncharacterized damage-inducible protein DinB